MRINDLVERTSNPRYTAYDDPAATGPNGEKLVVNNQGKVGYFKRSGRATNFVAYDPKAQSTNTSTDTKTLSPAPEFQDDYGDITTSMQGTPSSAPDDPEATANLQRTLASFIPGIGTALDVQDAIQAAKNGEYGMAAASGVFALLGLMPVGGAISRSAAKALGPKIQALLKSNPKFAERLQGKSATPPKVEPTGPVPSKPDTTPTTRVEPTGPVPTKPDTTPTTRVEPTQDTKPRYKLGPDGKPVPIETPPAARSPVTTTPPPASTVAKAADEVDPARLAALAGVTTAAGTAGKLAGKGDEVADLAKAADEVPAASTVAKAADDVADVGKVTNKADDVADVGKVTNKADDVADAGKLTKAQKLAIAGGAAATGAGIGYIANKNNSQAGTGGQSDTGAQPGASRAGIGGQSDTGAQPGAPLNLDNMSFNQAFAAARKAAQAQGVQSTGQFTWRGKKYQTNIKGEPYVPLNKQTPISITSPTAPAKSTQQAPAAPASGQTNPGSMPPLPSMPKVVQPSTAPAAGARGIPIAPDAEPGAEERGQEIERNRARFDAARQRATGNIPTGPEVGGRPSRITDPEFARQVKETEFQNSLTRLIEISKYRR